jgi:hypothetical protein
MAILQTKTLELADVTDLPIGGQVQLPIKTRLRELRFQHPSESNCELVFEPFLQDEDGKKQPDVSLHFASEPQPAEPPEDIFDPVTGEVLVAAGSVRPTLPSVAQLRAIPLPEGPQTITTFGDLFDASRRQLYLAMIALMPQWRDGTEG